MYIRLKKKDFMTGKEKIIRIFSNDSIVTEGTENEGPRALQYKFSFEPDEDLGAHGG